ncbi:hypothetical protein [Brucella sp.]|uniref:hypothetical protein n=1 Tax=Brucella sp. TaxID=52132 RepID=UPI0028B01346|nr:hypothetical protein [Brucella sp.]
MSEAPINRDIQIELMKNAAKRNDERMSKWMDNPVVRGVFARPTQEQAHKAEMYSDHTVRLRKYG